MAEPKSYIDRTKAVIDPEEIRDPELRELVEKLGNAMVRAGQETAVEKRALRSYSSLYFLKKSALFQTMLPVVLCFPVSRAKTARCLKTPFWQLWKA
jgi:hypothetical protein